MIVLPFLRVTVPVGAVLFATLADTAVMNVTGCPKTEGVPDVRTLIVVPWRFSSTLTLLLAAFTTARSQAPSPLKSSTAAA
jgi:hypothetical protein